VLIELAKILEASSESLRQDGAAVQLSKAFSGVAGQTARTGDSRRRGTAKSFANGSDHQGHGANAHSMAHNGSHA